jgi:hypothetical protein
MRPLSTQDLASIIKKIIAAEKIEVTDTLRSIAKLCIKSSGGIPRKVVMLFEKYYQYASLEEVEKDLSFTYGEEIDGDLLPMMKALDAENVVEFVTLFSEYTKGNWESLRIILGQVYKKRLMKSIIGQQSNKIEWYRSVLGCFSRPVDNQLGDIELVSRFSYLK